MKHCRFPRLTHLAALLCFGVCAFLLHPFTAGGAEPRPISLSRQLGRLNHPVNTTNEMAQQYFNQGLTLIFAFNHDAAIRSFERALHFDKDLAMAHWGI